MGGFNINTDIFNVTVVINILKSNHGNPYGWTQASLFRRLVLIIEGTVNSKPNVAYPLPFTPSYLKPHQQRDPRPHNIRTILPEDFQVL
jgi:hypothetical protein